MNDSIQYCKFCGEPFESDEPFCRSCGRERTVAAREFLSPNAWADCSTGGYLCFKCGCWFEDNLQVCPACGALRNENVGTNYKSYGHEARSCLTTDYENRCGNCHSKLERHDRYCRICGTKRGDGAFRPYENIIECIYGPMPVKRVHRCKNCGHKWSTVLMIDNEDFCPRCGGKASVREATEDGRASILEKIFKRV